VLCDAVAAALPTSNVNVMPGFTSDPQMMSGGVSAGNLCVAESTSHVGVMSSMSIPPTVTCPPPTFNTLSVLPPPAVTSLTPLSSTPAIVGDTTSATTTAWQPQPPQPSVVAGVDLNQLPPLQRQLFLRIHQQQKDTAVETASSAASHSPPLSQSTAPVIPPPGMTFAVLILCILSNKH